MNLNDCFHYCRFNPMTFQSACVANCFSNYGEALGKIERRLLEYYDEITGRQEDNPLTSPNSAIKEVCNNQ